MCPFHTVAVSVSLLHGGGTVVRPAALGMELCGVCRGPSGQHSAGTVDALLLERHLGA